MVRFKFGEILIVIQGSGSVGRFVSPSIPKSVKYSFIYKTYMYVHTYLSCFWKGDAIREAVTEENVAARNINEAA